jgi:hypothetical protein
LSLTLSLSDARKRAAMKADEIKRLANEKQKIREQELQNEAAADRQLLEEFVSKQVDASSLIQKQDQALQQILSDKERREKEGEEAIVRRSAAIAMARQNKAKKAELKRQRAVEAAKLKVEARSVELQDQARVKEEMARAQALLDQQAFEDETAGDADTMLDVEEAFLSMQSELERIEMSAKAAATVASQPLYRVKKEANIATDDDSENESDEIHQIRAKAEAITLDVDQVKTFDDIEDIDLDDAIEEMEQSTSDMKTTGSKKQPSQAKKKIKKGDKTTKVKKGTKKSTDAGESKDMNKKSKTKKKPVKQKASADGP